jgi:hypothetical protein
MADLLIYMQALNTKSEMNAIDERRVLSGGYKSIDSIIATL